MGVADRIYSGVLIFLVVLSILLMVVDNYKYRVEAGIKIEKLTERINRVNESLDTCESEGGR